MSTSAQKTVLLFPVNAVGHINATLAIADRLREDHNYRTVYVVLGPTIDTIEKHGHELIVLKEKFPYEDYEIEEDDDRTISRVDNDEAMRSAGKVKKHFPGHLKWPQIIMRLQHFFRTDPLEGLARLLDWAKDNMFGEQAANVREIEQIIASLKPDLIVFDNIVPPFSVLEQEYSCPWVQLRSANPLAVMESRLENGAVPPHYCGAELFTKQERERMRREEPDRWQHLISEWKRANMRLREATLKAQRPIREHLESHNCNRLISDRIGYLIDSPHLNIYLCPEELDYHIEDDILYYKPRWFRCNSLIRLDRNESNDIDYWQKELERGMRGKQEMVLFSLGSIASGDEKLVKKYIDMLKDDDKRLYVVSKGINGDNFELNASNMIGGNYIPQTWFLERAKLAIIHGGNNGLTECMHYGVPMIILPAFGDQLDNGQRIHDLGLGRRLNLYETNKQELRQTIDELLGDEAVHKKMQQIGRRMRERDDLGKISIMLKKLIEEKKLSQEYIEECRQRSLKEVQANGFSCETNHH